MTNRSECRINNYSEENKKEGERERERGQIGEKEIEYNSNKLDILFF